MRIGNRVVAVVSAALLALGQASAAAETDGGPEPEPWAEAFGRVRPDPVPGKLTRDSHYWISDEHRHDLFRQAVSGRGGVFVGLGTDQNYLMAGWARPEILVLFDFDQMVVNLHYAFRTLFLRAETPEAFLDLWSRERARETRQLLADDYRDRDPKFVKGVLRAFSVARRLVHGRLRRVTAAYRRIGVLTYLDDPEQYRFIRVLFEAGRVFPVRGDLTAATAMRDVAEATRTSGLTVRTLYLSNAEQYFRYTDVYRDNLLALPFDAGSVVLRTVGTGRSDAADGRYAYIVQSGENFRAWLGDPRIRRVWAIVAARKLDPDTGGFAVTDLPGEKPGPPGKR